MFSSETITLTTAADILQFDRATGCLVSLRSKAVADQEFIAWAPDHPAFVIGYLDEECEYRLLTSASAEAVEIGCERQGGSQRLSAVYRRVGGRDLHVTLSVQAAEDERFSRWRICLDNAAGLQIVDVQFPFLVCPHDLGGAAGSEAILLPFFNGKLIRAPGAGGPTGKLLPDSWRAWEFTALNGDLDHYPGMQFAQFLAYYNDRGGLYLACQDTEGNVKRFRALHREPGVRLGVAHVGDWPRQGERVIEYDTILGSFTGDWYDAATMYRAWSLAQKWGTPLHRRTDVPDWLLESPAYITIRPQGILDDGPVFPVQEFLPYEEQCIPLLARLAERVGPLAAVLMGWERAASWVYPDCFPPVGGDASMTEFTRQARQRGWHIGSFCNGTRWVVGHLWNGYDGRDYFRQHDGDASVCREADGTRWRENWDQSWRPSYPCCLGTEPTRRTALDFVKRLIGWGFESIQFFDQNCGAATFICFAEDHEHPPAPGKWMLAVMERMVAAFREAAQAAGEMEVINSAEAGVNECCLPLFQETDLRAYPPGHADDFVPLYQFLFHECIVIQGMMGSAPEPYHLPIRNAANCVFGELPGAVMIGDGTLLNKDTMNWAPWEPRVGSDDDAVEMIRTVTALRRGPGRDFLVFGRMLRPTAIAGIQTIEWTHDKRTHRIPAVFHATWQAPDGRVGIVLANWTSQDQAISVTDPRLAGPLALHLSGRELVSAGATNATAGVRLMLPPLSCALIEQTARR